MKFRRFPLRQVGLALVIAGTTAACAGPMMTMMGDNVEADGPPPPAIEGAPTIEVHATELEFEPDIIVLSPGEPLNIRLINEGAIFHDFAVPDLGFRLGAESGQATVGGLGSVPPGEYGFLCTVPGHAAGGMVGTLIVGEG